MIPLGSDTTPHLYVNLLREYRLREGLTQKQLAAAASISVSGLQKLEAGKHRPRPETAYRLTKAVHGQVAKVFPYGTEDNKPDAEKRAAMQEGRRRADLEREVEPDVDRRQCSDCKKYKDRVEYGTTYRKLKDGRERAYVNSRCRKCERERVAKWRRDNPEKAKAGDKRKARSERYREYQREWSAAKRRKQGKPVKGRYTLRRGTRIMLDSAPLLDWWASGAAWPIEEVDPYAARALRRCRPGSTEVDATPGKISLANADHIFTVSGRPDLLPILYPDE